jgi:hypothetical protein
MSNEVVIRIAGTATDLWADGYYLRSYEVDHQPTGGPWIVFTTDVGEALRFPDAAAAMECWRQQSVAMPLRPDGRPNRPLTAYSIEVVRADAAQELATPSKADE